MRFETITGEECNKLTNEISDFIAEKLQGDMDYGSVLSLIVAVAGDYAKHFEGETGIHALIQVIEANHLRRPLTVAMQ